MDRPTVVRFARPQEVTGPEALAAIDMVRDHATNVDPGCAFIGILLHSDGTYTDFIAGQVSHAAAYWALSCVRADIFHGTDDDE
jgi:hypothetical protein